MRTALQRGISTGEQKEWNKFLFRRKRVCVTRHTWADAERCTLPVIWITNMGHFFQVPLGQASCFAWFWVCIGLSQVSPHECMAFSARMDSSRQTYEKVDIFPFGAFLCMYSRNVFLDLKNEKSVVSYLGRHSSSSSSSWECIRRGQTPDVRLGPIYPCLCGTPWKCPVDSDRGLRVFCHLSEIYIKIMFALQLHESLLRFFLLLGNKFSWLECSGKDKRSPTHLL